MASASARQLWTLGNAGAFKGVTGRQIWRLAERAGRLALVVAVTFWWGGYVMPQLFSLAFPAVLSPDALPRHLNPEYEETVANIVSAAALAILTVFALANAVTAHRKAADRIAVGGWTVLTVTAAYLAWEEVSDFHATGLTAVERSIFGAELVDALGRSIWVLLLSPLIVLFVFATGVFVHKALLAQTVRAPFILGLVVWLLATMHEVSYPFLFSGRADVLAIVIEETLEFSGTLLIGLSAANALGLARRKAIPNESFGGRWRTPVVGLMALVAILGSLGVAFVFRAPVVDARTNHVDTFELNLRDQEAVIQELRMPAYPVASFRLRFASWPPGRGIVAVRVTELGTSEPILAEGFAEVPAGGNPAWTNIELYPQLAEAEGRRLAVWVVASIGREAELRLGATQTNRYEDGRLWINGALTWPDQDLEFVAYGAPEPTRSKFQAIWRLLISDWRWPALAVDLFIALTLITMIPTVLAAAALPRRS